MPDPKLRFDVDAVLARVTPKTRIVFIANPNNPTGSYLSHEEMRRLHAGLSPDTLLVIDAAYANMSARMTMKRASRWCRAFPMW